MAAEVENQPLDEHRAEHVAEPGVPDPVLAAGLQLRPVAEPEGMLAEPGVGLSAGWLSADWPYAGWLFAELEAGLSTDVEIAAELAAELAAEIAAELAAEQLVQQDCIATAC